MTTAITDLPRRFVKTNSGPRTAHEVAAAEWGTDVEVGLPGDMTVPSFRRAVGLVAAQPSGPWMLVTLAVDGGRLHNYATGDYLRRATIAERDASRKAATLDGGIGAFDVEIDGEEVTCYVDE